LSKRSKTNSFIAEFPLATTPLDERTLSIRLEAARGIYNACLGEALKRLRLMRDSKEWKKAKALPSRIEGKPNKARSDAFKAVRERFGFTSGAIQKFGEQCRDACWIGDHLGSHDTQTTTLRAFHAVEEYLFGTKGKPGFKRRGEFQSIQGKEQAVIRYVAKPVPAVHYLNLAMPLVLDPRDKKGWQKESLSRRVKYTRILKREIRGKTLWYAQLILEGVPPTKGRTIGDGAVGLDLGPSSVASFSLEKAGLENFCPTVTQPWKTVRKIDRALERSKRATNPDNFNANGTVKQGRKKWNRSARYQKLARERKEAERKLASERKRSHGELANQILAQGKIVKTEDLSYRAFQKSFGRSVKVRAPGMFIAILKRKAKAAGGQLLELSTRDTRLSQYDHTTDTYTKKPLSQREHVFGDGVTAPVQRDLYSAFLAFCCLVNILDIRQVLHCWSSAEPLLRQTMSSLKESASGPASGLSQGVKPLRADRLLKEESGKLDAVVVAGTTGIAIESAVSTINLPESPGFSHGEVQNAFRSSPGSYRPQ
jgi:putative transposase